MIMYFCNLLTLNTPPLSFFHHTIYVVSSLKSLRGVSGWTSNISFISTPFPFYKVLCLIRTFQQKKFDKIVWERKREIKWIGWNDLAGKYPPVYGYRSATNISTSTQLYTLYINISSQQAPCQFWVHASVSFFLSARKRVKFFNMTLRAYVVQLDIISWWWQLYRLFIIIPFIDCKF